MKYFVLLLTLFISCLEAQKVTVIGIGRTGLCLALCLEKSGYEVLGVDLSPEYILELNEKTFVSPEPGVTDSLKSSRNFRATTSLDEGLEHSHLYFIVVPTNPQSISGDYNCEMLDAVLSQINDREVQNKHTVIVSTVFPSYIRNIATPNLNNCPGMTISYNPMFIAQGDIMKGMTKPDVVLIGANSPDSRNELEEIQRNLCSNDPYFARMSTDSAEIAKLALNCYVTMKIAFANLVGDIADATIGAEKDLILRALGKDSRIGEKNILAGYGFGGPCFPRDNRALGDYANLLGIEPLLFRATDSMNQLHADIMAKSFLQMDLPEYLFEDVCYKSKCPVPIIEESQKLNVAKKIADAGKIVIIKDRPEVIKMVQAEYGDLFQYINN